MNLIEKAQLFAHHAHDSIKQIRKYTGEPYWVHTDQVASIVASVGGTPEMIMAAHLHDVEEDVASSGSVLNNPEVFGLDKDGVYWYNTTTIAAVFGAEVTRMVLDLTDQFTHENYPTWNRARRKTAEINRIADVGSDSQTIKLADLIANTESIVEHDVDFAKTYLREKSAMLLVLNEGNKELFQRAEESLRRGMIQIMLAK